MKNSYSLYKNYNLKNINNNDSYCYVNNKEVLKKESNDYISVKRKINDLFNSSKFVYKIETVIVTNDGEVTKNIVGRNKKNLITLDNELIPLDSIVDIKPKDL